MRMLEATVASLLLASLPAVAQVQLQPTSTDVYAGAGIANFDQSVGRYTKVGVGWNVHTTFNPYPRLGLEFNYQGARCPVGPVTLPNGSNGDGSVVLQNAFALDVKGTLPVRAGPGSFEPYVLGGFGFAWLSSVSLFGSVGSSTDNTAVVPVAAGVSYVFDRSFAIDGRFTYNFLTGERSSFVPSGNSWLATIDVGVRVFNRSL